MQRTVSLTGKLSIKVIRAQKAPISWRLSNWLRFDFLRGLLAAGMAKGWARFFGTPIVTSKLSVRVQRKDGTWIDYGVVSRRCVTTAGANWLVDAWQGTYEPETMKYHGCGTGVGGEVVGDTALGTECTTALNPDSTRATGSLTEGASANIFRSVGTVTFDGSAAVTEHGLFNQAATGGGTLWDRSLFSAINVASGDSIQFTYDLTINTGG